MDTRSAGWIFIIVGVVVMTVSVILVILAFTNVIRPSYFSASAFQTNMSAKQSLDINSLSANGGKLDLSSVLPSTSLIPKEALSNTLNLSAHFFLMVFIGGFGYKLAMIGVNLVRPIVIKSDGKTFETEVIAGTDASVKPANKTS